MVSERDIAQKFNISRSNSRKLLLNMEGEGLVRSIPQKGYLLINYSHTRSVTLFRVRSAIEAEAARMACENAMREDFLRMMLILDEMEEALDAQDPERISTLDIEFHHALVAASKDNMLIRLYSFIFIPTTCEKWPTDLSREMIEIHRHIFATIRARNPVAAENAIITHLGHRQRERELEESDLTGDLERDAPLLAKKRGKNKTRRAQLS